MEPRILSVQSHVVHGYVGNKSAVFPLQLLGFDVDIVNTVQFSNHTGYKGGFMGSKLQADEFKEICKGLETNELAGSVTHLLQGYCPSSELLHSIRDLVIKLKKNNPSFVYVCDPVMGDHGKLYVSEDLALTYRDEIVPISDFLIPNQFEAEMLTGTKIESIPDAIRACHLLHDRGVDIVVITSLYYVPGEITLIGSSRKPGNETCFQLKMPSLPHYYTGTGDLFGSLLLGWSIKHPDNLQLACEKAVSGVRAVISNTAAHQKDNKGMRFSELRLVQSRKQLENPEVEFHAQTINI